MDEIEKAKELLQLQSERLTLRTMADYVKDYVLSCCEKDSQFAEKVNDPEKSFLNCIKYIKEHALEWLKEQQKLELSDYCNGIGGDVPNDICYRWSLDYYNSKPEPKPKPSVSAAKTKSNKLDKAPAKLPERDDKTNSLPSAEAVEETEQISLELT